MVGALLVATALATPIEAELRQVAALPGEPRIVAAAGVRQDETPILTLENPDAFDISSRKLRVVVFSSGASPAAADGVVRLVRWFKRDAPKPLRDEWALSALPAATFEPTDSRSLTRWMTFQAPDIAIEVTDDTAPLIGPGDVSTQNWVMHLPFADDALRSTLGAVKRARSDVHETMLARLRREPIDIARLLARRYPETPAISYIPALAWVETLHLADLVKDDSLRAKVVAQTKPWVNGEKPLFPAPARGGAGQAPRIQLTSVAGTMIFDDLHADAVFEEGVAAAAREKAPAEPEYGQGWTDDMFMAASVLARSGVRPGHERDMDIAARLLTNYAARLQQPSGLFNHASNGPAAWGRGNGFAAFGLIDTLSRMPATHPARPQLLDIYRRLMTAVRANQSPDGSWRQIIDEPGAYREETATAMLLTATARGIRLGWLDSSYRASVDRAWQALAAHVADDGTLVDVCSGTGAGPTKRYYFDRPAVTGADDRGGAMALVAAMELMRLKQ